MSKNWFRKDFDYLVGRRLQRFPQHSSNRRQKRSSADRPQHLPHLKRHLRNSRSDGKNLQQKCFENRRHVKYTFTNQPFNSRLTLEPWLEIFGPKKILDDDEIRLGWNPGIFSNAKFVNINDRRKHGDKIIKNKCPMETFDYCMDESPIRYSPSIKAKDQQIPRLTTMIERLEEKSATLDSTIDSNLHNEAANHFQINKNEVESDLHLSNDDYSIISSEDNLSQFNIKTQDHETFSFENDINSNHNDDDKIPRKICKHFTEIFPIHYFQDDPYFQNQLNYNRHQIRSLSSDDTFNFHTNFAHLFND